MCSKYVVIIQGKKIIKRGVCILLLCVGPGQAKAWAWGPILSEISGVYQVKQNKCLNGIYFPTQ